MAKLNDTSLGTIRERAEAAIRPVMRDREFRKFVNRGLSKFGLPEALMDAWISEIETYKMDNDIINVKCTTQIMGEKCPMIGFATLNFELKWESKKQQFKFITADIYAYDPDDALTFVDINLSTHKPKEIITSCGYIQLYTNSKDPAVQRAVMGIRDYVSLGFSEGSDEFDFSTKIEHRLWDLLPEEEQLEDGSFKNFTVMSVFVEKKCVKVTITEHVDGPFDPSCLDKNERSLIDG